ncbi:MAG: glycosyltransferase [Candidatus Hydrogenedentota bacterium]|nr:MAG: glycosyltransferase [Candidatus Hydrogenedentota bacterium]
MMDFRSYLSEYNVAIVKHTYTLTGGAEQELLRYLVPRANAVAYVSHPFPDARGVPLNTAVSLFERGRRKGDFLAPLVKGPAPLFFAKDVLFTLWYLLRRKTKFQIYVGVDNLNAYTGLLLRRLGVVERVIFYVIDYAPYRFRHRLWQTLYRALDRRCCYGSDMVWNVSAAMEEARRDDGIETARCARQIEVPLGSRYADIPRLPFEKIDPTLVVFLGSLTREQGVNIMIEAMPKLRSSVPGARLRIIGDGPESAPLKRLAAERNVSDSVEFMGFVEDDSRAAELVAEAAVGIAPYLRTGDTFKRFADPGKVKIYLAAGLPVVISRVPRVAKLIDECEAGIAIEPDADSLADALATVLSSPEKARKLRANASELGKEYEWDAIFDRAFEQTFDWWRNQG